MTTHDTPGLSEAERSAIRESLGWDWHPSRTEGIPSPDEALEETYAAVKRILAARADKAAADVWDEGQAVPREFAAMQRRAERAEAERDALKAAADDGLRARVEALADRMERSRHRSCADEVRALAATPAREAEDDEQRDARADAGSAASARGAQPCPGECLDCFGGEGVCQECPADPALDDPHDHREAEDDTAAVVERVDHTAEAQRLLAVAEGTHWQQGPESDVAFAQTCLMAAQVHTALAALAPSTSAEGGGEL